MEKINDQLESVADSLLEGLQTETVHLIVFPRLEKYKVMADKAGNWKHRVHARSMIIALGYECDRLELAMAELIWLAGQWETNQEEWELRDAMRLLEQFIEYLPAFPNIALRDINAASESLQTWFETTFREKHYIHWALFKMNTTLGNLTEAEAHKTALLELEQDDALYLNSVSNCPECQKARVSHYYSSLGMVDKALNIAKKYLAKPITPCMTAPRTGLAYLLDALLELERLEDAVLLLPALTQHLDTPSKAPMRIVLPLLRYYLETEDREATEKIVQEYAPLAEKLPDRWTALKFYRLTGNERYTTKSGISASMRQDFAEKATALQRCFDERK